MYIISVYTGHNASVCVSQDGEILEVLELERLTNIKNGGWITQVAVKNPKGIMKLAIDYLMSRYNIPHFDVLIMNQICYPMLRKHHFMTHGELMSFFHADKLEYCHHQHGHMAVAFYQTDLQQAKGVSFDGGGSDGNFNVFECDRESGIRQLEYIPHHTLGMRYSEFGQYTPSIRRERDFWVDGGLVYPGKLMGLSPFGNVREEWLPAFDEHFTGTYFNDLNENYNRLKSKLNFPDEYTDPKLEADIVATAQRTFENKFDQLMRPYFGDQSDFLLSGGCALNIINNEKLSRERNIHVPPNPHDGGLALGFHLDYLKPKEMFDGTYMGPEVWDKHMLAEYVEKYNGRTYNYDELATDLLNGKIIGVVKGRSELGPRALGNRSILCWAGYKGMKDILNQKVKNREAYRPFAPVCRREDAPRWFDISHSLNYRWMNFCPPVLPEHRENLESITHVDGTARLQTVLSHQNDWLYYLLSHMQEGRTDYGVLLNTSFNIAGKPILNSYKDAIWMLENTQMDGLILEDFYIKKP